MHRNIPSTTAIKVLRNCTGKVKGLRASCCCSISEQTGTGLAVNRGHLVETFNDRVLGDEKRNFGENF